MAKKQQLFGIDFILSSPPHWKKQRLGLLTNDAALTCEGENSRSALLKNNFNLVRLFSPEHGIETKGKDGQWIPHKTDEITNLPIVSLYQDKQNVNDESIEDLDVLIVDLPDVGARFYTYLWSMTYIVETAAKHNKKIVILDRPNPLGGDVSKAEGPMLKDSCKSFIGRFNIPITHYCTLGELALYFNKTKNWNANLTVIPCRWNRQETFLSWEMPWTSPSPALVNFNSIVLYPGLCFLEATNISVARNSPYSFQWIGIENYSLNEFNFTFENVRLYPKQIYINEKEVSGMAIELKQEFNSPVSFGLKLLYELFNQYKDVFSWEPYPTQANPSGKNHLDLLIGIPNSIEHFELPRIDFNEKTQELIKTNWRADIQSFLLYF